MKKFLSIVSLMLVVLMLASVPSFAAEDANEFVAPNGIPVYYANDISSLTPPIIDGEIKEGEYGKLTVNISDHLTFAQAAPQRDYQIDDARADAPASESFDFYFAYDENFYYIAYVDYGAKWDADSSTAKFLEEVCEAPMANYTCRNNYALHLGFDLTDVTYYLGILASSRGWDESKWYEDNPIESFKDVTQAVSDIILKRTLKADPSVVLSKADASTTSGGNANSTQGQYVGVVEVKIQKSHLVEKWNEKFFTDYTEFGNAMWFDFIGRSYVFKADMSGTDEMATSYNRYFGTDIRETKKTGAWFDYGIFEGNKREFMPSLVVFGEPGTVITGAKEVVDTEPITTTPVVTEPATTEPVATEPVATEPAGDAPVATTPADDIPAGDEPSATEPAATEPAVEGGCAGVVSFAGIALVAALGTCTVFVAKKKEN